MSLINVSSFQSDLKPIVKKWFGDSYKDHPQLFSQFMQVESSTDAFDVDAVITGMGTLQRKDEGNSLTFDSSRQEYTPRYTHLTYSLGFIITKEMMQDGKAMKNAKRFTDQLKRSAMQTKEILGHNILNYAYTSGYTQDGGDGVILASAAHPSRAGNQSNIITAADLSEASLEQMYINIRKATDNRGLKINLLPKKLVIPVELLPDAERILGSNGRVATADNDLNFIKGVLGINDIVASPYLTDVDQFQIITDSPDGLKFKVRQDMEIDTDNDFLTKNAQFSVDMRTSAGWSDFRGVFLSAGV